HGLAAQDGARQIVDPAGKRRYLANVERNIGEIGRLSAQRRCDAVDRKPGFGWRLQFSGLGELPQQAASGLDFAVRRQLDAENAKRAPCDAASADRCIEDCVPTPRHTGAIIAPAVKPASAKLSTDLESI